MMVLKFLVISSLVLKIQSAAISDVSSIESGENIFSRGLFTKHCGPGQLNSNITYKSQSIRAIDDCCRVHDECPDYITTVEDYQRYPNLVQRSLPFSKMHCDCDYQFLACLARIDSFYARSIRQGYKTVQLKCFQFEYPAQKCLHSSSSLLFGTRCNAYLIDVYAPKQWQWFDIPVSDSNGFPRLYFEDYLSQQIGTINYFDTYT